ncbi:MAG: Rod shape-determining protein MreD [Bacteroidota bacterium]
MLIQLPLIHRITLFDRAFGFFYVGFLLLLPVNISRSYLLIIGFFSGLLVDVFSNTPGIHASACVFIMFFRNFWLSLIDSDWRELSNLNILSLKTTGFFAFILPLIFVHHLVLFMVENGGFHFFGQIIGKVFFSTLFSGLIIFLVNFTSSGNRKKA